VKSLQVFVEFPYLPEKHKVFKHRERNVQAIHKTVAEEQDKEFVVGKVYAVVDPRTVVIYDRKKKSIRNTL
jgi:hypothetical protein